MAERVLAIFAHPDDESLFCGGTLAKHVEAGDAVRVVVLADGVGSRSSPDRGASCRRQAHFTAACRELGVVEWDSLDVFFDQEADGVRQLAINKVVERIVQQHKPTIAYTHFAGDLNLDHRRVAEAVLVATRGLCPVYCATPEWPTRCVGRRFEPDVQIDITATMPRKLAACACYVDELRDPPHPRSLVELGKATHEVFEWIR